MLCDASVDGLGVVPGCVDVVEADWVDLVESRVEVDQEPEVVELKKAPHLRCPFEEWRGVAVERCWHRQPCVGMSHHVDVEGYVLYRVAVVNCYRC